MAVRPWRLLSENADRCRAVPALYATCGSPCQTKFWLAVATAFTLIEMFTIEFDQSRNLLVIRYGDHVGPDETLRALGEMRLALNSVERGFRLLADLTELCSMDLACAPHIESAMDLCNEKGVAQVVRIIPDPRRDIGMQIMSYFHYGGDVRIITCESADEAMSFLDE